MDTMTGIPPELVAEAEALIEQNQDQGKPVEEIDFARDPSDMRAVVWCHVFDWPLSESKQFYIWYPQFLQEDYDLQPGEQVLL
jgi:hypothetical protein